jgi:hypothetical protein
VLVGTHRITLSPLGLAAPGGGQAAAAARVFVDTPDSQLQDSQPPGGDAVATRSALFVSQLATNAATARVARDARVPERDLRVAAFGTGPALSSALPREVSTAIEVAPERYVVHVDADPALPVITLRATAPDAVSASRLAVATVAELKRIAAPRGVTERYGYVIESLGPAHVTLTPGGSGRGMTAGLAFVALVIWAGIVVILPGIARWWRGLGAAPAT